MVVFKIAIVAFVIFLSRELTVIQQSSQDQVPQCTYDGDFLFNVDKVLFPTSLTEIQGIVKEANHIGRKIRVLGAGHSRSAIALSEDLYISLRKYRGLVTFDENAKLATFRGGTRLSQIIDVLEQRGFTLKILPAIDEQTIAGAISTATHGSGSKHGNLATLVKSLQIVAGTGEVINISKDMSPDLFHAVGVSLGLFGVITEVTLSVEEVVNLEEKRVSLPLSDCISNVQEISTAAEYVKLWIELNSEVCYVHSSNRSPKEQEQNYSDFVQGIKMRIWEWFQWVFSILPSITGPGMKMLFSTNFFFPEYNRVVGSKDVHIGRHYMAPNMQSEVAVPFKHCAKAINSLYEVVQQFGIPVNHIVEIRFVKGDNFFMSNDYQMDSCHITLMFYNPSQYYWNLYSYEFYRVTLPLGGRPHWGKHFNMTSNEVESLYPDLEKFLNARKQLDPNGLFLNSLVRNTFGFSDEN